MFSAMECKHYAPCGWCTRTDRPCSEVLGENRAKPKNSVISGEMKRELLKELFECETPTGDMPETYTTGYRNGYRNGRAQLIRYVLGLPGDERSADG